MANLVIRPFVPEDYLALAGEPTHARAPAFTGFIDGQLAACAGVDLFGWAPVGTAWAFLGPVARQHGGSVSRGIVRGLWAIIETHGLVRVEADCFAEFPAAARWMTWMGFKPEGAMARRGPQGETMLRWVLFP